MNYIDINNTDLELIELFGEKVLFANDRLDRSSVPNCLFVYDLRENDYLNGEPCEIAESITVNHLGTVITTKEIKLDNPIDSFKPYRTINPEKDINFLGEWLSVKEYMERYM